MNQLSLYVAVAEMCEEHETSSFVFLSWLEKYRAVRLNMSVFPQFGWILDKDGRGLESEPSSASVIPMDVDAVGKGKDNGCFVCGRPDQRPQVGRLLEASGRSERRECPRCWWSDVDCDGGGSGRHRRDRWSRNLWELVRWWWQWSRPFRSMGSECGG